MTYSICCALITDLETLTERGKTAEDTDTTLVDRTYSTIENTIEDLAQTFHTTITQLGVLPRELNDMRLRLTKLETELRIKYFDNADNGQYAEVLSEFYIHYGDIQGLIVSAMDTRGMDYDQPHILTSKGFFPLDKEKEEPLEE